MKKIVFLLVASVTVIACHESKQAVPKNSDWLSDNLSGKVQQLTDSTYKTDSTGKITGLDSCCVVTSNYDEKGYSSAFTSVNKAGTDKEEGTFTHDSSGLFGGQKFTKNGKMMSSITVESKDGVYSGAQSFDSTNKMDAYYTDITANDYGRLTAFKQYKPDSSLKSTMTFNFNNQFLKDQSTKDSAGKEIATYSQTLDDKNNVVASTYKEIKKDSAKKDSAVTTVTKYSYDSYDDTGNWTQRTEMNEKGTPVKIVKRTITYYKD